MGNTALLKAGTTPVSIFVAAGDVTVRTLAIANIGSTLAVVDVSLVQGGNTYSIVSKYDVPGRKTLSVFQSKDIDLYLQDGDSIVVSADKDDKIHVSLAYEGNGQTPSAPSSSSSSSSPTIPWGDGGDGGLGSSSGSGGGGPGDGGWGPGCLSYQERISLTECERDEETGDCQCGISMSSWEASPCEPVWDPVSVAIMLQEQCPGSFTYCRDYQYACCNGQFLPSGPNSKGEACPEGEECYSSGVGSESEGCVPMA